MKTKELIIKIIVCIMAVGGLIMSYVYLLGPTLLPYHFAFLGKTQSELDPQTLELLMTMKQVIGGHFLAITLGVFLLIGRLARGDVFARWSALVMVLISQCILLYAAYEIHNTSPVRLLNVAEIVLVLVVFFLSRRPGTEKA